MTRHHICDMNLNSVPMFQSLPYDNLTPLEKPTPYKEGGKGVTFTTFTGFDDRKKALSFLQQFDRGGNFTEASKVRKAATYLTGNAGQWWTTLLLQGQAPSTWIYFKLSFASAWLSHDFEADVMTEWHQLNAATCKNPDDYNRKFWKALLPVTSYRVLCFILADFEQFIQYTSPDFDTLLSCDSLNCPDCLVGCAKEHRPFPRQGYTCCLAMEGVKVLATGFEKTEKAEIERIIKSMCGEIESKAFTSVSFVIAKDVLAAKYKFAVSSLRRPILKLDWLFQCWREHRLVPCEPFRLPPFLGLVICATNIPLDERKEIEDACRENGGSYSADLTKKCTHLIANTPQGDKFRVARRWGTVKIINRHWFGQCLAAKVCLDEDLFPVNAGKEKAVTVSQVSGPPTYVSPVENTKKETFISSAMSVISNTVSCDQAVESNNGLGRPESSFHNEEQSLPLNRSGNSGHNDDNMYLSNCRIYFSGFLVPDLRKYVTMVRDGGGTRFMEFNDRVTHVIFGDVRESLQKDMRHTSCTSSIHFVRPLWLEECHQQKKEVIAIEKHLLPVDFFSRRYVSVDKSSTEGMHPQLSEKQQTLPSECFDFEEDKSVSYQEGIARDKNFTFDQIKHQSSSQKIHVDDSKDSGRSCKLKALNVKMQLEMAGSTEGQPGPTTMLNSNAIFKGYTFAISDSIPVERRAEIVQWVMEGGGLIEKEGSLQIDTKRKINFLVVTHGSSPVMEMDAKLVSSHWIRFCLEEKKLLNLDSHVLYQPLQCQVPFPGFETLRLCVSQYEEKDRLLLRNLCFVLGVKFTEKLNKKVTHLLCKVKDGQKYHAACNWGINVTTADWLFACVRKDRMMPSKDFQPRELSAAEKGGILGMTQGSVQATRQALGEAGSESTAEPDTTQSQEAEKGFKRSAKRNIVRVDASMAHLSERNKYFLSMQSMASQEDAPFLDPWDVQTAQWSGREDAKDKVSIQSKTSSTNLNDGGIISLKVSQTCERFTNSKIASPNKLEDPPSIEQPVVNANGKENHPSSDVAAAIEGLLAQTSKLKGQSGFEGFSIDQEISPEHTTIKRTREEPRYKRAKHQAMSTEEMMHSTSVKSPLRDSSMFDESQMESQIVGYDEDHTGKQLIIERVRTRSMSTTRDSPKLAGKAASWRNDGLGRLFKVAEDNK
ncbi:hypothetical protein L7F22_058974 [Adiantum nelumboides]|nr:hypothetical protein [Adiantum nelumboides]